MIDLAINSHSQDTLSVKNVDSTIYVVKTFYSNLQRAEKNVAKQREFPSFYDGVTRINAAQVTDFVVDEHHVELTMPFVEGLVGPEYAVHLTRAKAKTLAAALSMLLYKELALSTDMTCPSSMFLKKAEEIRSKVDEPGMLQLIDAAIEKIRQLDSILLIPQGPCHGDLTLSNVIYDHQGGVTLIDFLDTYLESPLQDLAKLKQDFTYGWSFRHCPVPIRIKSEIFCSMHAPAAITHIERMYPRQSKVMTLMTLLRIAPYIKDDITEQWLKNQLGRFFESECW